MTSTELVPLQRVWFRGGAMFDLSAMLAVPPLPKNTMDVRWLACTDHHTACDCREAELAEQIGEYRGMWRLACEVATEVLAGHRIFPDSYERTFIRWEGDRQVWAYEYDKDACCSCTGCVIVRKGYLR